MVYVQPFKLHGCILYGIIIGLTIKKYGIILFSDAKLLIMRHLDVLSGIWLARITGFEKVYTHPP